MLEIVPYELDKIKNQLKIKAMEDSGITDAEYEGSNISQLINLMAYSIVINNTNLTFGLNEMFISQAQDRNNIIKHARQLGYLNKRKISYQYKIKLQAVKSGLLLIEKYMKFFSEGKQYNYMGESFPELFGTYLELFETPNEYNNSVGYLYDDENLLLTNSYITSEENQVLKVLQKGTKSNKRLLLEAMDSKPINTLSTLPKDVMIWDGTRDNDSNYRNLTKIGTVDTYLYDTENKVFKVQITLVPGTDFPVFTKDVLNTNILDADTSFRLEQQTQKPIKMIESIVIDETINIDLSQISYNIGDRNISIKKNNISISEEHNDIVNTFDFGGTCQIKETPTSPIRSVDVVINGVKRSSTFKVKPYNEKIIEIDPIITDSEQTFRVINNKINTYKNINAVALIVVEGKIIEQCDINGGIITICSNCNNKDALVVFSYFEDLSTKTAYIGYDYNFDLVGLPVEVKYSYDKNTDGDLDYNFYFSDLRGEMPLNEMNKIDSEYGWEGFIANSFDAEINVLTFDIKHNKNMYCKYIDNLELIEPKSLHEVFNTPYKKNRYSITKPNFDIHGELTHYDAFDELNSFCTPKSIVIKDTLELIVKEGITQRWNEETQSSIDARQTANNLGLTLPEPIYVNDELTVYVNDKMVEERKFIINKENIEENGIELFITRILPNGIIERDIPWKTRTSLLSEKNEDGIPKRDFVAFEHPDYSNYIEIYTNFANSGIELTRDFIVKMNLLISSGAKGETKTLIKPESENFKAINIVQETETPIILHTIGSDEEDIESIRENAPLYSNTVNRAVTENDYKTICNSQGFIKSTKIWGGEAEFPIKKPGHIFFSIVPNSKPSTYIKQDNTYLLSQTDVQELFYPTYYQITGKDNYYGIPNKEDQNVLFNVLDNYKIITLQLNYVKTIYIDYHVEINILKYKTSKTLNDTRADIFNTTKDFFKSNVELFELEFYKSSLVKYIDNYLGDGYGVAVNINSSVDLYDNLKFPELGMFINETNTDATPNSEGISGAGDYWKFQIYSKINFKALFEDNVIVNYVVIEQGDLIINNLMQLTTENFLEQGDLIYLDTNINAVSSINIDGLEFFGKANSLAVSMSLNIMYKKSPTSEAFKVGQYYIDKANQLASIKINSHLYNNINNQTYIDTVVPKVEGLLEDGITENLVKSVALPRSAFEVLRTLKLNIVSEDANNEYFSGSRTSYGRLKTVLFT